MANQTQEQQFSKLEILTGIPRVHKRPFIVALILLVAIVWILSALSFIPIIWATVLSAISSMLGILSFFQGPLPNPLSESNSDPNILPYPRKEIYENTEMIEEIYRKLVDTKSNIEVLVLTGEPGIGKSFLAGLLYHYAEEQRLSGKEPFFKDQAVWQRVDGSLTVAELTRRLVGNLGKDIPRFRNLPPENQALAFLNAFGTTDKQRLIFVDQFENFLDKRKVYGSNSRIGVDELVGALREMFHGSGNRLVLTSSSMPWEVDEKSPIREYRVQGFKNIQSLEFLEKKGLPLDDQKADQEGKEATELSRVLERYRGNALALTLLASILRHNRTKRLIDLIYDRDYIQLLTKNDASQLLDYIYTQQLGPEQPELIEILEAFSIYREPVPLEAAQKVMEHPISITKAMLDNLCNRSLLLLSREDHYRLHPVVAQFTLGYMNVKSEQDSHLSRQEAHIRAAQYYRRASLQKPWNKLHMLVEATWHLCRAELFQEAYQLMEQEHIYTWLSLWGGNAILLELYELMLPLSKWRSTHIQAATIYNNLGELYMALERREEAFKNFKKALPLFKEEQDYRGAGRTLNNLGWFYSLQGQEILFWTTLERYWDAAGLSGQILDRAERIQQYRRQSGEAEHSLRQALDYLEQALPLRREVGDRGGIGKTLHNLGRVYSVLGDKELAVTSYEEALATARETRDRIEESQVLYDLGQLYNTMGKKERVKALDYLNQALSIQQDVEDHLGEGLTWNSLGYVYDNMGRRQDAWKCYQKALRLEREVGDRRGTAITVHNMGMLYFEEGPYEEMEAFLRLSKAIFEEMRDPYSERADRRIQDVLDKLGRQRLDALAEKKIKDISPIVEKGLQNNLSQEKEQKIPAYLSFRLPSLAPRAPAQEEDEATDHPQMVPNDKVDHKQPAAG